MQTQNVKSQNRQLNHFKTVRVSLETLKKSEKILILANKKKYGRKIKFEALVNLALELLSENHIQKLQESSMTNEDRKEQLRQKYIEKHGPISKDDFTGFMLTKEFFEFQNAAV